MTIRFSTSFYEIAHGTKPRGWGAWAFQIDGDDVRTPAMSYADAKRWIAAYIRGQNLAGDFVVEVLP